MNFRIISSRPWLADEDSGMKLEEMDFNELKLIASFLWTTRLGAGMSPYRDAAFTLMQKIEALLGDDFMEEAATDVDLHICIMDASGYQVDRVPASTVEFDV